MTLEYSDLVLLGLGAVLVLATVLVAASAVRGTRLRRRIATIEQQFETLKSDVAATTGIGVRVGEKLRRLDQVTAQMGERLGQLELRGEGRPYDQAIALVRRGADADRLMANYGLSRGEADLVALVHGNRLTA
jgi:hypothetical protein